MSSERKIDKVRPVIELKKPVSSPPTPTDPLVGPLPADKLREFLHDTVVIELRKKKPVETVQAGGTENDEPVQADDTEDDEPVIAGVDELDD